VRVAATPGWRGFAVSGIRRWTGLTKALTDVALVDARRLDYYHALEQEHASLVLADDAVTGLRQALAGQLATDDELDQALGASLSP